MLKEKILLVSLPFWTPLIPPLGLACLKSFLQSRGYEVVTEDANVKDNFREIYNNYFKILEKYVPEDKRGNFYSIGHDVLRSHLMAHLHYDDEKEYKELIKILIYKTYYCPMPEPQIDELNKIVEEFYTRLESYFGNILEQEKPTVLGLSVCSDTLPASLFAFKLTRDTFPHIKTIMGGGIFADQLAPGSSNLEIFLEKTAPFIDKIIIGEGENLFLKFLKCELPESQRVYTRNDLEKYEKNLDLSSVDIPDFSDFALDYYPYMTAYTSRSCPYQCSFCAETVNWGKYRKKNARQSSEELIKLYKKHGYQLFLIGDSLLNPVITGLSKELIDSDVSIYWDGYLRVDEQVCNTDNVLLWRRGGFYRARLGIESGSPRILEMMNKKITPRQIKAALSNLAYAGIKTTTYWIIGYPGETEEDFQRTLNLVEELKNNIYESECKPFYYHPFGQVKSKEWLDEYDRVLLYPHQTQKMLMLSTWLIDCEPPREEIYQRVSRFIRHCKQLGIPNPYSLNEIYHADDRWKKMHKNAVPPLVELRNKEIYIDECKNVKKINFAETTFEDNQDFVF